MRSILFFLLSVCYVIVSGQKVKVHVKGIKPTHTTLEFKDDTQKLTKLKIGTDVVANSGVIGENALEIGLVAKSASILAVALPEKILSISKTCTAECMKFETAAKYKITAKNVDSAYTTMKCTIEGETTGKDFLLDHNNPKDSNKIPVISNEINQHTIDIEFKPETCVISGGSVPIELKPEKTCTDVTKCMQLEAAAQYKIFATAVEKQQTKMKCKGKGIGEEDLFTLEHKSTQKVGSGVTNKVEVSVQGVIQGVPISLDFNPERCIIEKHVVEEAIEIKEKVNCDAEKADCFQNIVDDTKNPDSAFDNSYTLGLFTICVLLGNMF